VITDLTFFDGAAMASLSKKAVQRLAVLHTLGLWRRGAYGPVRVHKTLFFADRNAGDKEWHLFTFKKWRLGQYSDEIADALNRLRTAGCICTAYDGPSERIVATIPEQTRKTIGRFFKEYFYHWHKALVPAFHEWAYLTTDSVITKAHEDDSYSRNEHGQTIVESFDIDMIEFQGLSDDDAEALNDAVDEEFQSRLIAKADIAVNKPTIGEDWRSIYFGQSKQAI
jgi:hypothetical protein